MYWRVLLHTRHKHNYVRSVTSMACSYNGFSWENLQAPITPQQLKRFLFNHL